MQKMNSDFTNKIWRGTLTALIIFAALTVPARSLALENKSASFTKLDFVANIETVGVAVSGANFPATAELLYRQSNDAAWRYGHPLARTDDGRLLGSLFGLLPSTSYEVKVRDGSSEISGTVITQADELQFTPTAILYVDDNAAPSGDGSPAAPFRTIQEGVNRAAAGTQVLVADGIYQESVVIPNSGSAGNWIQIKAQGNGAILDGSKALDGQAWTLLWGNIWQTRITSRLAYLARDQKRFYEYDTLAGLKTGIGHNNIAMPEGWYIDYGSSTLYVRSLLPPSGYTWQIPFLNSAIETNAQDWIWLEGLEMRFYGVQASCGVCAKNSSHLVIRKNKIHNVQKGIYIEWTGGYDRGNDTRIEYNEIYDPPVDSWPWRAVKATSMEGTGIIIRGHIGAIVRENQIHNFFNGIYTGSSGDVENPELAFDADIYNNRIYRISDDALEPEGACMNQRFRSNTIDYALVGVSLAPITKGPVWVLRSTISNYTGRSIKLDRNSDGVVLIYHNTSWTKQPYANAIDVISPVRNTVMRNNIFWSSGFSIREVVTGSTNNNWDNDNWYTTYNPRFKWENIAYSNLANLCAGSRLECKGFEQSPGLINPAAANFGLTSSSPNIDRGMVITGINDNFSGKAPDIGAFEFASGTTPPAVTATPPPVVVDAPPAVVSITRADANPTNSAGVNFIASFTKSVSGVDAGDFNLAVSNITGAFIMSVTPVSTSTYTINVNTGSGDGTIGLNIIDNDSILDAAKNPLGGVGTGNGNFVTGEIYTVNKSPATPTDASLTFNSIGTQDGWVLEAGETFNKGGTLDRVSSVLQIGDDNQDRQFKSILSFNTDPLPDGAVITSAKLSMKKQGVTGTTPFNTHGNMLAEIRSGAYSGNTELVADDFSAASSTGSIQEKVSIIEPFYTVNFNSANLAFINKAGLTQIRIFFSRDDNDDLGADYLKIFSGNALTADQPQLIVTYTIPSSTPQAAAPAAKSAENLPPVIASNTSISISENITVAATITANDTEPLTYSIIGGVDMPLFSINASTGALNFITAPNYELPADSGLDNIYNIAIQASDGNLTTAQEMIVTVAPINDNAPVMTSAQNISIMENTAPAATITATDADLPAQILNYSIIGGMDAALFNLNASTGELIFITAPDYEHPTDSGLDNIYNVTIQTSDGNLTAAQEMIITVTPMNDNAPLISSGQNISMAENINAAGMVTAADADLPAQALTYAIIGGADAPLFNINSITGELIFITAPDHELPADSGLDNIYNVTIQTSDGNLTTAQEMIITTTPMNDNAPLITSGQSISVAENINAAGMVTAADADLPAQTLTYAIIGGADSALFNLNSSTGELTFITAPNYELPADSGADNIYNITVQASDEELTSPQDIAVTITPVNDNAPVITSDTNISIAENASAVTTVISADADLPAQILNYSIAGGADAALFGINASTGELTFITAPDHETPVDFGLDNIYNVIIQISDGELIAAREFTVTVTPVNDNAPVITSPANINIAENLTNAAIITAADSDLPGQTLNYSITGGADAAKFAVDKNAGALNFITAPDYETPSDTGADNVYNVSVQASDGELFSTQEIAITLTPVNDNAPVITSISSVSVAENTTAIINIIAKDADLPAQPLTYTIIGGTDAAKFSIIKETSALTFITAPDFESPADAGLNNIYEITIQVSDGVSNITQNIIVAVADANETPAP